MGCWRDKLKMCIHPSKEWIAFQVFTKVDQQPIHTAVFDLGQILILSWNMLSTAHFGTNIAEHIRHFRKKNRRIQQDKCETKRVCKNNFCVAPFNFHCISHVWCFAVTFKCGRNFRNRFTGNKSTMKSRREREMQNSVVVWRQTIASSMSQRAQHRSSWCQESGLTLFLELEHCKQKEATSSRVFKDKMRQCDLNENRPKPTGFVPHKLWDRHL